MTAFPKSKLLKVSHRVDKIKLNDKKGSCEQSGISSLQDA